MRPTLPLLALLAALGLAAVGLSVPAHAADGRGVPVRVQAGETPGAGVVETVELYADSHALVIGIDDYRAGWPRLSMAVADARAIAAALTAKGFGVTLVLNPDARALQEAFETFYIDRGSDPEARLFVWFAGHGHSERGEGFLVPADAPRPDAGSAFFRKALSLRRIGEYVRLARAKHALAVFDSCFAGTVFDSARALPPAAITRATARPVRQFLSSGDAGQTVSDDGSFRTLFLRALAGEEGADANGDGYVTASELGLFLTDRVTNLTRTRQTPRYGKLRDKDWDRGDFVFRLPAAPATVAAAAPMPPVSGSERARGTPGDAAAVRLHQDTVFWESVKDSGDAGAYRAYLDAFPQGTFRPLAEARLRAAAPKPAAPKPTAKPPEAQTALASPPAARAPENRPESGPAIGYLSLPVGATAEYDDGWTYRVTGVDGATVETRATDQRYVFIHAGAALTGGLGISMQINRNSAGASRKPVELLLETGKEALAALWPLRPGNAADYTLEYDTSGVTAGSAYSEAWEEVDDSWRVTVTFERMETVEAAGKRLEAALFRSEAVSRSGRRFAQRHWYHPGSGLILRLERVWEGKRTENSAPGTEPGKVQRIELVGAKFPAGAANALR